MEKVERMICYNHPTIPKPHQIEVEKALKLELVHLVQDVDDSGYRLLSRADLILIFTLYTKGLEGFLEEYKNYAQTQSEVRGYNVVNKPHYYLKNIIG